MKDLKYITWEDAEGLPQFVLFPQTLQHIDMRPRDTWHKPLPIVGAGFARVEIVTVPMTIENQMRYVRVVPYGRSDSLNIGPSATDFDTLNQ